MKEFVLRLHNYSAKLYFILVVISEVYLIHIKHLEDSFLRSNFFMKTKSLFTG